MKIFWKIILVLVGLFIAVTLLGLWGPKVASYWREYKYDLEIRRAEEMTKAINTAYKNDHDGGTTPEETFDLLLTALKSANTLQASKYYKLSVQPKALGSLQTELAEFGNLQKSVDYFTDVREKGVKFCNEGGDGCNWNYEYTTNSASVISADNAGHKISIPAGSKSSKFIDIEKNKHSLIWKVTQPF